MTALHICLKIAVYEARLLVRSWGFRIFSLLSLLILGLLTAGISIPSFSIPYYFRSLSGAIPLFTFKLFNVYQGIIVLFMATEFFKRDRRTDSTQVIFSRSFSNTSYLLGKFLGILGLFVLLNLAIGLIAALVQIFLSAAPFSLMAYISTFLVLNLPTLLFMIGLSFVLGMTIRSQAAVVLMGLALAALSLVILGNRAYFIPDIFGFHTPLIYSDFIGMGNGAQLFALRFPYILLGLGLVFVTVLLAKRLRQSTWTTVLSGALALLFILSAFAMMFAHVRACRNAEIRRQVLMEASARHKNTAPVHMEACSLDVNFSGGILSASAEILFTNRRDRPADSLLLTLNPGLKIGYVRAGGAAADYLRDGHILLIRNPEPLSPGESITVKIDYSGMTDESYCYPDIENNLLRKPSKLGLFRVPKKYTFLSESFIHLTPESGWYPRPGIPLSHRYPGAVESDFCRYALRVSTPAGQTAVSQGLASYSESADSRGRIFTFQPETPLPQISLTVGKFEERSIDVKGIVYKLFTLRGHDYFTGHLDGITKDLPKIISRLKDEFEVILGLDYPFEQLALVEVPIHFFSHKRLWSSADETVQPQVVFLPEMGTLCDGADFAALSRWYRRWGKGGNAKGTDITPAQIQTDFFNSFVRTNLLGTQPEKGNSLDGGLSGAAESDVNAEYNLLPEYFTHTSTLASDRWPILHSALESWLQNRISSSSFSFDRREGLTEQERTNRLLEGRSLADLTAEKDLDERDLFKAFLAKGRYLMTALESRIQTDNFDEKLLAFIKENSFSSITEEEFLRFLFASGEFDLEPVMDAWYKETRIPAFTIGRTELSGVRDGERERFHILLPLTNISETEGIVQARVMTGDSKSKGYGSNLWAIQKAVLMPPQTTKEIGFLLDTRPVFLTLDTTISGNIPAAMNLNLWQQKVSEGESFFEGERASLYEGEGMDPGIYIVDNEDEGFAVAGGGGESPIRSFIRRLFDREIEVSDYSGYNPGNPPGRWSPVILQEFYGRIIRSGYMIKVGEGANRVTWTTDLKEAGTYDIYFYNETADIGKELVKGDWRKPTQEEKHFIIHSTDGTEEIDFDCRDSSQGWVLLGTFLLPAGENTIEQTDKGKGTFLTADAVKWIKRDK